MHAGVLPGVSAALSVTASDQLLLQDRLCVMASRPADKRHENSRIGAAYLGSAPGASSLPALCGLHSSKRG